MPLHDFKCARCGMVSEILVRSPHQDDLKCPACGDQDLENLISSLSGADLPLLVTEPTLSGIHDLERVLGTCHHFGIPTLVYINKYDFNNDNTRQIESYCFGQGVETVPKIPFDNVVTEALVQGQPVVEYCQGKVTQEINALWQLVVKTLER